MGQVFAYMRENWKTIVFHNLGFSLLSLSSYAGGAWIPEFYRRRFHFMCRGDGLRLRPRRRLALRTEREKHQGAGCRLMHRYSSTTSTTRRFSARSFLVLFDETGALSP